MCNTKGRTPHKHRDLIRAWADGAEIEYYDGRKFIDCPYNRPEWRDNVEYRIKPEQSDLEKYGVEVGDVWMPWCNTSAKVLVSKITKNYLLITRMDESGIHKDTPDCLSGGELIFRRGVVNKL